MRTLLLLSMLALLSVGAAGCSTNRPGLFNRHPCDPCCTSGTMSAPVMAPQAEACCQ